MKDEHDPPWVPPGPRIELEPTVRPSAVPQAPAVQTVPFSATTPVRRRRWFIPTMVVSGVVVVALVSLGVVSFVSGITSFYVPEAPDQSDQADQPLTIGVPASPVAVEPLECPPACFTRLSIADTILPPRVIQNLGVPDLTEPFGTHDETTAGYLNQLDSGFLAQFVSPEACWFAPSNAPYSSAPDHVSSQSADPIFFLGTFEDDDGNYADQSVRLFPDSAAAEAYLADLRHHISECTEMWIGPDYDLHYATIDPAVSINPPRSIAAMGWVRTGDPGPRWRAYVYDIQRGNLVVRLRLLSDGSITEQHFRRVVQFAAAQLASLKPVDD